jgi:hypothetical protein
MAGFIGGGVLKGEYPVAELIKIHFFPRLKGIANGKINIGYEMDLEKYQHHQDKN